MVHRWPVVGYHWVVSTGRKQHSTSYNMIEDLYGLIEKSTFAAGGDLVDKFVSFYTVMLYLMAAASLSLSDLTSGYFECLTPSHWPDWWTDFATRSG